MYESFDIEVLGNFTEDNIRDISNAVAKWDSVLINLYNFYPINKIDISFNTDDTLQEGVLGGAIPKFTYDQEDNYVHTKKNGVDLFYIKGIQPIGGTIVINENELENLSLASNNFSDGNTRFYYVILHEIGHILGLLSYTRGSFDIRVIQHYFVKDDNTGKDILKNISNLEENEIKDIITYKSGDISSNIYYTVNDSNIVIDPHTRELTFIEGGSYAVHYYNKIFNYTDTSWNLIPIENNARNGEIYTGLDKTDGTYGVHPEEGLGLVGGNKYRQFPLNEGTKYPGLGNIELMTGWLENSSSNFRPLLSKITLGFLQDIGYEVNYEMADNFPYVVYIKNIGSEKKFVDYKDEDISSNVFIAKDMYNGVLFINEEKNDDVKIYYKTNPDTPVEEISIGSLNNRDNIYHIDNEVSRVIYSMTDDFTNNVYQIIPVIDIIVKIENDKFVFSHEDQDFVNFQDTYAYSFSVDESVDNEPFLIGDVNKETIPDLILNSDNFVDGISGEKTFTVDFYEYFKDPMKADTKIYYFSKNSSTSLGTLQLNISSFYPVIYFSDNTDNFVDSNGNEIPELYDGEHIIFVNKTETSKEVYYRIINKKLNTISSVNIITVDKDSYQFMYFPIHGYELEPDFNMRINYSRNRSFDPTYINQNSEIVFVGYDKISKEFKFSKDQYNFDTEHKFKKYRQYNFSPTFVFNLIPLYEVFVINGQEEDIRKIIIPYTEFNKSFDFYVDFYDYLKDLETVQCKIQDENKDFIFEDWNFYPNNVFTVYIKKFNEKITFVDENNNDISSNEYQSEDMYSGILFINEQEEDTDIHIYNRKIIKETNAGLEVVEATLNTSNNTLYVEATRDTRIVYSLTDDFNVSYTIDSFKVVFVAVTQEASDPFYNFITSNNSIINEFYKYKTYMFDALNTNHPFLIGNENREMISELNYHGEIFESGITDKKYFIVNFYDYFKGGTETIQTIYYFCTTHPNMKKEMPFADWVDLTHPTIISVDVIKKPYLHESNPSDDVEIEVIVKDEQSQKPILEVIDGYTQKSVITDETNENGTKYKFTFKKTYYLNDYSVEEEYEDTQVDGEFKLISLQDWDANKLPNENIETHNFKITILSKNPLKFEKISSKDEYTVAGYKDGIVKENIQSFHVPDTYDDGTHGVLEVTEVKENSFLNSDNDKLESVTGGKKLKYIRNRAFYNDSQAGNFLKSFCTDGLPELIEITNNSFDNCNLSAGFGDGYFFNLSEVGDSIKYRIIGLFPNSEQYSNYVNKYDFDEVKTSGEISPAINSKLDLAVSVHGMKKSEIVSRMFQYIRENYTGKAEEIFEIKNDNIIDTKGKQNKIKNIRSYKSGVSLNLDEDDNIDESTAIMISQPEDGASVQSIITLNTKQYTLKNNTITLNGKFVKSFTKGEQFEIDGYIFVYNSWEIYLKSAIISSVNGRCVSKYTCSVTDQRKKRLTKEDYLNELKISKSCIDMRNQTAATRNPRNIVKPPVMMDSSSYIEQLKMRHLKCDDDDKKRK